MRKYRIVKNSSYSSDLHDWFTLQKKTIFGWKTLPIVTKNINNFALIKKSLETNSFVKNSVYMQPLKYNPNKVHYEEIPMSLKQIFIK